MTIPSKFSSKLTLQELEQEIYNSCIGLYKPVFDHEMSKKGIYIRSDLSRTSSIAFNKNTLSIQFFVEDVFLMEMEIKSLRSYLGMITLTVSPEKEIVLDSQPRNFLNNLDQKRVSDLMLSLLRYYLDD